jgi:hypothetical protein
VVEEKMTSKMDKYGIYTTLGNLISGDDIINSSQIVKTLTACSTSFYLSYENRKTIIGTTLDVQKSQTRVHTVVFLQEINWKGENPGAISRQNIDVFFKAVFLKLGELDYYIKNISSYTFNSYLTALQQEKNTVKHDSHACPKQIVNYTIGRLLYGKKVLCTSADPQISISYLSDLTQTYESFLKYGYSFAITKFAIKDCDVSILIDTKLSCVNFDVDSGNIYDDSNKLNHYLAYSELIAKKYSKLSSSFPLSSNKASLPSDITKLLIEKKLLTNKEKREEYIQFLNSESISFDQQLLETAAPTKKNKPPKREISQPLKLEKETDNNIENESNSSIIGKLLRIFKKKKVSVEEDSRNVCGDCVKSNAKYDKSYLSDEPLGTNLKKGRSSKSPSKNRGHKEKIGERKNTGMPKQRGGINLLILIRKFMLVILLIITAVTVLVILKKYYIP